jgi:hypothetical protein
MLPKHHIYELSQLAEKINDTSRLVANLEDGWRPSERNWAPWIKPFEGNFPRKMPVISNWVQEANQYIEDGRGGGIGECPFEFYLTDILDQFWVLSDRILAMAETQSSQLFIPSRSYAHLLKEASFKIRAWSFQFTPSDLVLIEMNGETVAMLGEQKEGIYVGPFWWRRASSSKSEPRLRPLRQGGFIPGELLDGPAALPVLLDAVRRAIIEFHSKHGFCSNCCNLTHSENLHGGECATCAGIVN